MYPAAYNLPAIISVASITSTGGLRSVQCAASRGRCSALLPRPATAAASHILLVVSLKPLRPWPNRSSFSNYGAASVDLGAPGSGIWSTVPARRGNAVVSGYDIYSGTSSECLAAEAQTNEGGSARWHMGRDARWATLAQLPRSPAAVATPHVTGAAALYAAHNPGKSAADIKAAILDSATPTASLAGRCVTGGRLNVAGLLGVAPTGQ